MDNTFSFEELIKVVITVFSAIINPDSFEGVLRVLSLKHKTEVLDSLCSIRFPFQEVDLGDT